MNKDKVSFVVGIVVTVGVFLFTPSIPSDMPTDERVVVFIAQCILSAFLGILSATFIYDEWERF